MNHRYSELDKKSIQSEIINRFYDKYDISPDKKIKKGQKYTGFITSINRERQKIHLTIGGNNEKNITVFVKTDEYALDLDSLQKFDEFHLRVSKVYPKNGHVACKILKTKM